MIVYYAHYVLQDGTRIEFSGTDYETVARRLEAERQQIMTETSYWPAGLVQSFR